MKYKALSLWQPWASAIFEPNQKTVETRAYPTDYRGRLYIHATLKTPEEKYVDLISQDGFTNYWLNMPPIEELPRGAILGHVDLYDCVSAEFYREFMLDHPEELKRDELWGIITPGRFVFMLRNPVKFEVPIPARGQQNFGWDCEKFLPEYAKQL